MGMSAPQTVEDFFGLPGPPEGQHCGGAFESVLLVRAAVE